MRSAEHDAALREKPTEWMALANCAGLDADFMFPERGENVGPAKAICARCCVRDACLDYALTPPVELWGIWGGTTARERKPLRRARRAA